MCKICKTCNESNFGVIIKRIEERAARMVNDQIIEYFEGSEEVREEMSINYCFTCSKEIAEDDLIEESICKICKGKNEHVNKNGLCIKCAKEVAKLSEASKEDLILMLIKQNKKNAYDQLEIPESYVQGEENEREVKNKREKNNEILVKNNRKSDTIKRGDKSIQNVGEQKVEIDMGKNVLLRRKKGCKYNDKIIRSKKENNCKGNKDAASTLQENMEKAIIENKEEVKDVAIIEDIKEDINIYNINKEKVYSEVVDNTLMEIEEIINGMSNKDYLANT